VQSLRDAGRLVSIGERLRHTATTSMNQRSSRSHTLFSFKLEVRNAPSGEGSSRMATVQICDLAGRENEQTSECTGERFRELTFINRSLFQLANCVHALSDGSREHVPFRNSKLTMLLSESFQRNSRTYLLATLTPSASGYEENLLTCRFLESTGRIATQPTANRFSSEDVALQLQDEIERMRQQLGLSEPQEVPAQLKSRQHLLNYLSGGAWAQHANGKRPGVPEAGSARAGGAGGAKVAGGAGAGGPPSRRELAQQVVLDACNRVGKCLDNAATNLERLDSAHASVGASLGKAESQLTTVEVAVTELRHDSPSYGGGGGSSSAQQDAKAALRASQGLNTPPLLPPLLPSGGKPPKEGGASKPAAPAVTFSVQLPPIVVL